MVRWPRVGLLAVFTLVLGLVAAACGGGEEATPTRAAPTATTAPAATARPQPTATAPAAAPTGKITVALGSFDNEVYVPWAGGRFAGMHSYGAPMYDWLVWMDKTGGIAPGVLAKWEMAADAKSWTVAINEKLVFHNGDKVAAADVKFVLENLAKPEATSTGAGAYKANIASVDVLSPTTARINLKNPWPLFPYDTSLRGGPEGAVLPSKYFQQVGQKEFESKPIGSGPWKLVGHAVGVRFVYETTGQPHPYRATPKVKQLEELLVPEESTRMAMLKTNAADIVEIAQFQSAITLTKNNEGRILRINNVNVGNIFFGGVLDQRIKGKPVEKRDVRLALELAVNKQEIVDTILGGFATVAARTFITPGTLGWVDTMKPRPYDTAQAKKLLADNGYANGFEITIWNNGAPGVEWLIPMTEAVAGYWSAIGVRPKLNLVERSVAAGKYRARPQADDFIGAVEPIWSRTTPTNIFLMRTNYHSKGVTMVFPSPEMDSLIDQAISAIDAKKQADLITQAQNLQWENVPDFAIAATPSLYGIGSRVASWTDLPGVGIGVLMDSVVLK